MQQPRSLIGRLLVWRIKHVNDQQFVIFLSIVLGIVGGLTATLLKYTIHHFHALLTRSFDISTESIHFFLYPILGIALTVLLIQLFYRGTFAHGITNVLYAISRQSSIVKVKDFLFFALGSLFTVGLGGSVGMEATLVMTGSGVGSNTARLFRLPYPTRILLLGAGAAAALSGFFHAPIAGVIFALEVLMLELTMASLVPLLVASITGTIIVRIFMPNDILFNFSLPQAFQVEEVGYYIILGVICAALAFYFAKVDEWVDRIGKKLKSWILKSVLGAGIVGLLIFLFPPLFGEGYPAIESALNGNPAELLNSSIFYPFISDPWMVIIFIVLIILVKAFAVALTLGSGGIGGYFAPSLFVGGLTGFAFSRSINMLNGGTNLPEASFTLVGMAGAMSGLFYAPLTAIFLIAEITSGYGLIIPLMIVATISYLVTKYMAPHSIFTRRLAARGELITHHRDRAVITMLNLRNIIEKDFKSIGPHNTLGEFLKEAVAKSHRNLFPVLDDDGKLVSIVLLDDVRPMIFKQELYDQVEVNDLMRQPPTFIYSDEPMDEVIKKFDKTNAWNLPVIDRDEKYIGFISKSKLLSAYRDTLRKISTE